MAAYKPGTGVAIAHQRSRARRAWLARDRRTFNDRQRGPASVTSSSVISEVDDVAVKRGSVSR